MTFDVQRSTLQVLLAHVLDKPRAWVMAHPEFNLADEQMQTLEAALARVERGEPLPYVLGRWEFFGLDFLVTPDVLIPRPETELLVEQALEWWKSLTSHPGLRNPNSEIRNALDVGTGSGCIAIALAVNVPELRLTATDISSAALAVARANAQKHGLTDRIQFIQADLFDVPRATLRQAQGKLLNVERFDLIVANLPYIPTETLKTLEVYGREPSLALDGGPDGLAFIRRLLHEAPGHLAPGGRMLLEIEASQGAAARSLATEAFPSADIRLMPDLAGHDRVVRIQT